jgi:hypothetical protein
MPLLVLVAIIIVPHVAWPQGDPLGPEFRINTYTPGVQGQPAVAAVASGGFVVVWQSNYQDGSGYGIFGQRYDGSGTALGPEFRVNTYTTFQQRSPFIATDASGNFVVVWSGVGQDGAGVLGQRYASSGAPLGTEFRVNTTGLPSGGGPSVAVDDPGNFVVIWMRGSGGGGPSNVFGQRYASSGVPLGTEFRVNAYTTGVAAEPAVASDAGGNFVVVWDGFDGASSGIVGQRYASSGVPLGSEFRVNTYTTGDQYRPAVASDPSGGFVVVWRNDSQGYGVFGQRFTAMGTAVGPEFRVNTSTGYPQDEPSVAADDSGNFVVAWRAGDGSFSGIYAQRYDSSGVPNGAEFRVNTFTTNSQIAPAVGSDAFGNFVVVWSSLFQDGSNYGVFGQRYSQIVPVELMHFRVE